MVLSRFTIGAALRRNQLERTSPERTQSCIDIWISDWLWFVVVDATLSQCDDAMNRLAIRLKPTHMYLETTKTHK